MPLLLPEFPKPDAKRLPLTGIHNGGGPPRRTPTEAVKALMKRFERGERPPKLKVALFGGSEIPRLLLVHPATGEFDQDNWNLFCALHYLQFSSVEVEKVKIPTADEYTFSNRQRRMSTNVQLTELAANREEAQDWGLELYEEPREEEEEEEEEDPPFPPDLDPDDEEPF